MPTLVSMLAEPCIGGERENRVGVDGPGASLELCSVVSVVESVTASISVTADPDLPVVISDVVPTMSLL